MSWRTILGAAVVLALVATYGLWRLERYRWAGGFRTVTPHFSGGCQAVEGVPGPEDLLIDADCGFCLYPVASGDFRPHGLSLHTGADGERRLFVVNHPPAGDTVEVFDVRGPGEPRTREDR